LEGKQGHCFGGEKKKLYYLGKMAQNQEYDPIAFTYFSTNDSIVEFTKKAVFDEIKDVWYRKLLIRALLVQQMNSSGKLSLSKKAIFFG